MATEKIQLWAKANKLGIENYRKMNEEELRTAIKNAETGSTPAKTPAKGKAVPSNGKTTPAKGRAAVKAAPAKGKSVPAKGKASTSKQTPAKSTRKAAPAKGKVTAAKGAQAKRSAPARGKTKPVASGLRKALGKINWNKPSNVGTSGKRKDVLDALREHKGDKAAAFKALKRRAPRYYPDKDQHGAERMLVWLIGRVAYDYAYKTGQHEPGERAAYGTSESPQDVRRRELRAEASKPKRSRRSAAKGTATTKATASKGRASKGRSVAPKGRKTVAAKRGRR